MKRGSQLVALAVVAAAAIAWAGDRKAAEPHRLTLAVSDGRHERLDTPNGPVHAWIPAGYDPATAATIVYVHGYYVDVDHAWTEHQLPEQFALSAANALFIACEAPSGSRPPVRWHSLGDLVGTVLHDTGIVRPEGPTIAIGHSGAYRTFEHWLDEPFLDVLVLVDATYGALEPIESWVRASPRHRLIDVTEDTVARSEQLARALADLDPVVLDRFPLDVGEWPEGARDARVLTVRAQWSHMALVTGGIVLPLVIRLLPVTVLADAPWDAPPGELP